MIVLNLQCEHDHAFEGWFASLESFDAQVVAHQVACPQCESRRIDKRPTAPRLNLRTQDVAGDGAGPVRAATGPAHWVQALHELLSQTEDVGERFAEEARRIHYGESIGRSIRGVATSQEAQALLDEGIDVFSLPVPSALKGPLQ